MEVKAKDKETPGLIFNIVEIRGVTEEKRDFDYFIGTDFDSSKVKLNLSFQPSIINSDKNLLEIFIHTRTSYLVGEKTTQVFHYDIVHVFHIANFSEVIKKAKEKYSIDLDNLAILTSISISGTRGFIAARNSGPMNAVFTIPAVNPQSIVSSRKKDIKKGRFYFD